MKMSLSLKLIVDEFNLRLVKPSARSIYEFEQFRLDAEHLMLYRDNAEISLTPKQVETLLALVERCGEIVSKEVLMSRLWGNTAVEESNLVQHIHFLRKVLGEAADGRQMIETLRRRGYRFNGRLREPEASVTAPLEEVKPLVVSEANGNEIGLMASDREATIRATTGRITTAVSAVGAMLVLAVLVGYLAYRTFPSPTASKAQFAALPLEPIDVANRSPAANGASNEEANRRYLLAQNFIEQRGLENGRKALEQIERAVALDPNFARAWATKAYIHRYIGYGAGAHEQYLKTKEAVEKALAIDPNLSEAYSVLCFNKSRYEYDFTGAESACRRAVELDPNSPLAHKLYGNFLYTRGRFDESFAEIKKAMDLQPVSYDNQQTYALALYFARRYDEEEALWRQLHELNPDHIPIVTWLTRSLQQQGREREAFEYLIKKLTMDKADDESIERFKFAYRTSGWRGVALERIKIAVAKPDPDWFEIACLYSTIDDKDKAFENLEKAYQQRSNKIAVLQVEPQLDLLRDDARYADLIRRVEGK